MKSIGGCGEELDKLFDYCDYSRVIVLIVAFTDKSRGYTVQKARHLAIAIMSSGYVGNKLFEIERSSLSLVVKLVIQAFRDWWVWMIVVGERTFR